MTNKLKHNKKRNVGIIYELLVRNMTKALVANNLTHVNKIKSLIENHFNKKTELYKEYKIFSALSTDVTGENKSNIAKSMIVESKKMIKKINNVKLEKEKSNLIREINYKFGKKFYFEHVPNYVNLATIQIALNEWKKETFDVKKTVLLEEKIISNLISLPRQETYKKIKEDIDKSDSNKIVMNIMTKKINEKYENMNSDQKELIKNYVFFFENNQEKLVKMLKERKNTSLKLLKRFKNNNQSNYLNNKIDNVADNIKRIDENNISDETIIKFLTVSQLISELKSEE